MKKILYILPDFVITALYIGAYLLYTLSRKKLGFVRWINYHEAKWREYIPIEIMRFIVPFIIAILVFILFILFLKDKTQKKNFVIIDLVLMPVTLFVYITFTVLVDESKARAYYLMLPVLGIITLIQTIKVAIEYKMRNDF